MITSVMVVMMMMMMIPIEVTLVGIVTDIKFEHSWKTLLATIVRVSR
jgi:hypothetical protein